LIRYADIVEAALAPGGGLPHLPGYASKSAEQAARIAGVLTMWRDLHAPEVSAVQGPRHQGRIADLRCARKQNCVN